MAVLWHTRLGKTQAITGHLSGVFHNSLNSVASPSYLGMKYQGLLLLSKFSEYWILILIHQLKLFIENRIKIWLLCNMGKLCTHTAHNIKTGHAGTDLQSRHQFHEHFSCCMHICFSIQKYTTDVRHPMKASFWKWLKRTGGLHCIWISPLTLWRHEKYYNGIKIKDMPIYLACLPCDGCEIVSLANHFFIVYQIWIVAKKTLSTCSDWWKASCHVYFTKHWC